MDNAVTEGYAMQHVLQECAKDQRMHWARRWRAAVLAAWIGSEDISPQLLITRKEAPSLVPFVLQCFRVYPLDPADKTSLRSYYANAQEELRFYLTIHFGGGTSGALVPAH